MTKVITKHGVHPNGIFIGDYLREGFCDESYKIYLYVTSISDPSIGQIVNYIKSIGFTFITSTDETIELTHQDISLIADFDSFRDTEEYNYWFRYNYGR